VWVSQKLATNREFSRFMFRLLFNLLGVAVAPLRASVHAPTFDGIFTALNPSTAAWDADAWSIDLHAMSAVGMSFFVVPHLARQHGDPTAACPAGLFEVYFAFDEASKSLPTHCFKQAGLDPRSHPGGTVVSILTAANQTGMGVHLGLALQTNPDPRSSNETVIKAYAWLQWQLAQHLWDLTSAAGLTRQLLGFYTELEESNGVSWLSLMPGFAGHYLQPLAHNVKTKLRSDLLIWASPYAVGNRTRYSVQDWMVPAAFSGLWEQTWAGLAPDLDLVALQDSTGALGNSFADVQELLGNMSAAAARQHRSSWTNVELFEVWPQSCQWPDECHGRHPAPFARIKAQLENEAPLLMGDAPKIIAWEWSSCLSPTPGNGAKFPDANRENYNSYKTHVQAIKAADKFRQAE
jgi:hypothetical protein